MNKAQARAATAKLLAVNPHRAVMEAFMDGAQVTLLGEHLPAPRWTADALYVAFKGGKEVARSTPPPKQDEEPEKSHPTAPLPEEETPATLALHQQLARLKESSKGVSTWDRFKDLGVAIVDACQAGRYGEEYGWAWQIPGCPTNDPSKYPPVRGRHYDVIRRDGYLFKNVPEERIKWGAALPGYEAAEVVRFRMCSQADTFASPAGSFMKATSRIFSKSFA